MPKLTIITTLPENAPMSLLLEADPSEVQIQKYLEESLIYVAMLNSEAVGVCVVKAMPLRSAELMNIAVCPTHQSKGIGSQLLLHAIKQTKQLGIKTLTLGTGTFGYQLSFYQRVGFRVTSIDKDFFLNHYDAPIFENGIQHKDMLRLTLSLQ
ncbi:GNAT family N-acetyltransferase [Photobacterium makurazakiensis]|uniref:GNAT family N-acetyltransferase n=1 Tax=Photobacterium makurazakiensis TaxID=2910234 RepID=UPI003D10DF6F